MKIDKNKQVPNMLVYGVLYAIIFATSIWLLVFHKENTSNWILYVATSGAAVAALVKVAFHSLKKYQQSA